MKASQYFAELSITAAFLVGGLLTAQLDHSEAQLTNNDVRIRDHAAKLVREGRSIFRFDTFGSEAFWGGALVA